MLLKSYIANLDDSSLSILIEYFGLTVRDLSYCSISSEMMVSKCYLIYE